MLDTKNIFSLLLSLVIKMNYVSIGGIIREYRKRAGLSQAALCDGLCELPTMNKIENGRQNPNKKLLDALLQRLQVPLALNIPVSDIDFERTRIENQIIASFSHNEFDIYVYLMQYKSVNIDMDKFERQFYLFAHSVYEYKINKNYLEAIKGLHEAIAITFPLYSDGCDLQNHLFTSTEFSIINNIAICLYFLKEIDTAINVMEQLATCIENRYLESDIYACKYPMIAYNLSLWLGITKQYEKSLLFSRKGIDCCIKCERYAALSGLLYNSGFTLVMLKRKEEAIDNLKKSLAFDSILQNNQSLSSSIRDIEKTFGNDFLQETSIYKIF